MTGPAPRPRWSWRENWRRDLRPFAAGIGFGFLAGVLFVGLLVWRFPDGVGPGAAAVGRAPAADAGIAERQPARGTATESGGRSVETAHDGSGHGVLEQADAARAGAIENSPPPARSAAPDTAVAGPTPARAAGELADRGLLIPVDGVTASQLSRQFSDPRGEFRKHEAIDILAPRNSPVKAVEDGRIARLFLSKAGGITIYQFDPSERYCYYYAHLERYADGLREGDTVKKGQVIGFVGTTGNAPTDTPHLHFAIFQLTDAKRWWEGTPIDPFDILR